MNTNKKPDIPLGLGMSLAMNMDAMSYFGSLSDQTKSDVIKYIQNSQTGYEAKQKVNQAVSGLSRQSTDFMSMS